MKWLCVLDHGFILYVFEESWVEINRFSDYIMLGFLLGVDTDERGNVSLFEIEVLHSVFYSFLHVEDFLPLLVIFRTELVNWHVFKYLI